MDYDRDKDVPMWGSRKSFCGLLGTRQGVIAIRFTRWALLEHQRIPTRRFVLFLNPILSTQPGTPTFDGYPEWNKEHSDVTLAVMSSMV